MTQPQPFFLAHRSQGVPSASAELALTLLGPSASMSQLWNQVRRLAPHVRTVLLTGDPDCGQEAVARLLLDLSSHAHRSFLVIPAADAEDRLARSGSLASFPTEAFVFLPDAHRLSLAAQDGLLRLMRLRRSRPFTVVAAASEDLRTLVGIGRFSAELADALGSVRLAVPCLKQRLEDIPMLLAQMFSSRTAGRRQAGPQITEDFLRAAMGHTWPGNLRELSRTVDWLSTACAGESELYGADLGRAIAAAQPARAPQAPIARMVSLDTVVQEHIVAVLRACSGNKLRAAEVLGISRSTLYRMLDAAPQTAALPVAS